MVHPAAIDLDELSKQIRLERGRSSGPGGQHRNKVETKVTLTHIPTGILASAGERRSAEENRRVALSRLRLTLAMQVRLPVPAGDQRSDLWRSRCDPNGRIVCSPSHWDFPALLAEALDMIEACNLDHQKAALRLCCTPTQLAKLVRAAPHALQSLNARRSGKGLHPLR